MKKLLSIFSTFTAVSVMAPTVVSCGTGSVKIADLAKELESESAVKTKVKEFIDANASDTKKNELVEEIKIKLEAVLKSKLDKKDEFEKVAALVKNSDAFEITVTKDGDKAKVKVTRKDWKDNFETDKDKKEKVKKTFELIEKASANVSIEKAA